MAGIDAQLKFIEEGWSKISAKLSQNKALLAEKREKQHQIKDKAVKRVVDTIKKEAA